MSVKDERWGLRMRKRQVEQGMEHFRTSNLSFWCLNHAIIIGNTRLRRATGDQDQILEGDFSDLTPCFAVCWLGEPGQFI